MLETGIVLNRHLAKLGIWGWVDRWIGGVVVVVSSRTSDSEVAGLHPTTTAVE